MKDLFKLGRCLDDYLETDGSLKRTCITCLNRNKIGECGWSNWLCKAGNEGHLACNPVDDSDPPARQPLYLNWIPRVDVNWFIKEEDLEL